MNTNGDNVKCFNVSAPDFPPRLLLSNSLFSCWEGPAWGSKLSGLVSGSSSRGEVVSSFAIKVLLTGLEFRDDAPLMWSSWAVEEESVCCSYPTTATTTSTKKKKNIITFPCVMATTTPGVRVYAVVRINE